MSFSMKVARYVGVACVLLTGGLSALPAPDGYAATLEKLRKAERIPGMSAAVVWDGRVVLKRGFGFANLETRVRATPDTPYNIASVSKPIAAVVALRLVEEGKLDLERLLETNEDFAGFCNEFRSQESIFARDLRCGELTMRHVLSHTVNGKPGERFSYNPVVYSMGSRPMSAAGGKPFSALVEEFVFRPADMKRSARIHRELPLRPDLARALAPPYKVDDKGKVVPSPPLSPQGDGAGGGVVSTVADLAKFDVALDAGRLVSPRSREGMITAARSSSGAALPYGLGFFVQEHRGRKLVWHSGWWEKAYSAIYLKLPEERLTLILLANSEGLWWGNPLDKAQIEKSPFVAAFLEHFPPPRKR
ncbi:MAG TPA: serine hydrolase domain-containing protein [Thermoanaerobaculia bacterium]|nr:serine hydrolase domain-containing protein [Thermoanaerobaculia bacterium]